MEVVGSNPTASTCQSGPVSTGQVDGPNPSGSTIFAILVFMTLRQRKIFWFLVWLAIVLSGPFTVLRNAPDSFSNDLILINVIQRLAGLTAFSLLFVQIMLGSFMGRWVQILGARAFKFHVTEGLVAYGFILTHPLMQVLIDYKARGVLGAFLTLLPGQDIFLNFGKMALVLLTIAVPAAYLRTKPFFRRNWRVFHILNYLAFFFIVVHSRGVGTDVSTPPFVWVHRAAILGVTYSLFYRFILPFVRNFFSSQTLKEKAARS